MSDQPTPTRPGIADDFEDSLAAALSEAHETEWRAGNWAAIQRWNEWVGRNGLRLEEYLRRIGLRGRTGR